MQFWRNAFSSIWEGHLVPVARSHNHGDSGRCCPKTGLGKDGGKHHCVRTFTALCRFNAADALSSNERNMKAGGKRMTVETHEDSSALGVWS